MFQILKAGAVALSVATMLVLTGCGDSGGGDSGGGDDNGASTANLGDREWGDFGREGDIVLGDMDAPISVIEWASVTCGHCAAFDVQTYPFLKEEYIDTGLVRFTMRELPTSPTNMARLGFMIARCVDESRYYNFIDALMRTQSAWAFNPDANVRLTNLARLAAQAGLSQAQFDACRLDQAGLDRVNAAAEEALATGIQSTPTFYINGELFRGSVDWETFEGYLIPFLPEELRPAVDESSDTGDSED